VSTPRDGQHLAVERAAAIAAGARPVAAESEHLLRCATCRAALAELDPSALFALLAHVPAPVAPPALTGLPLPPAGRRSEAAAATVTRLLLAAAAVLLAAAALLPLVARRAPEPGECLIAARAERSRTASVVRRVDQPGARIVTLLPPSPDAPSVTMILGTEIDL
jgi:hypothetical protein